jgi:hypothetical protein
MAKRTKSVKNNTKKTPQILWQGGFLRFSWKISKNVRIFKENTGYIDENSQGSTTLDIPLW